MKNLLKLTDAQIKNNKSLQTYQNFLLKDLANMRGNILRHIRYAERPLFSEFC